jgi:hypothetical protein
MKGKQLSLLPDVSEKLILSFFDRTGNWVKPWIEAGYPVMLWDMKYEGDLLDFREFEKWILGYEQFVYGMLFAPPCTEYAGSGARWWAEKDKNFPERLATSNELVEFCLGIATLTELFNNLTFWALENPVGRIEKCIPDLKGLKLLSFNPCDYGDPYTKRTNLWGRFNPNLPKNPVEPQYVTYTKKDGSVTRFSPQHGRTGGATEKTKEIRSATPMGFAYSFFEANKAA